MSPLRANRETVTWHAPRDQVRSPTPSNDSMSDWDEPSVSTVVHYQPTQEVTSKEMAVLRNDRDHLLLREAILLDERDALRLEVADLRKKLTDCESQKKKKLAKTEGKLAAFQTVLAE